MGISGLIPFVKKSTREVDLQSLKGQVAAVDAYCWLHKGAFSCADKLIKGEKTDGYVIYCMKYVNLLLNCGLKPILVFDGQTLPSKAETEKKRRLTRATAKQKGKALLAEGKYGEAVKHFQAAVDISPSMAFELIQACRSVNVDCIVAPYEADAQLAYLNKIGLAQVIITEDSDLIPFGCDKVLFKLNLEGRGQLYDRSLLNESLGVRANSFTIERFRQMCILSGCDYLPSLPGIGLGKSMQFFSKLKPSADVYSELSLLPNYLKKSGLVVSKDYRERYEQADNTFLYQLVYDPVSRGIIPLNPYPPGKDATHYPYAGLPTTPRKAFNLAIGNLNVFTYEAMGSYNPDEEECVSLTRSYSWSNSVKRAPHPSIWRPSYSSQEVFKSPRKTPKKSPRKKLAFGAEKTLITSFLISPTKKVTSPRSKDLTAEGKGILSQYSITATSNSPQPSPEKPKKARIESDYSSVEWTPTKIKRKKGGVWEDEEDPIGAKISPSISDGVKNPEREVVETQVIPDIDRNFTKMKNPFTVLVPKQGPKKRLAYSALSIFEKMKMTRSEHNQEIVISKYFSSTPSEAKSNKKPKLDEEASCFDYFESDSGVESLATSIATPTSPCDPSTPQKRTDENGDSESPILSSKLVSSSNLIRRSSSLKQRNLLQAFAYQRSVDRRSSICSLRKISDDVIDLAEEECDQNYTSIVENDYREQCTFEQVSYLEKKATKCVG
ncbi:hypothetical protein QYM36_007294 [Artemia franciscana]|uniref:Exonuclease 1 n=1 Tax=Artemia franciscana TaxID=6661 RepID=A0AA88LD47_ARTSF|nr:hypothetical protein QYM36_007294 [Artemia franciscana]